MKTMTVQAEVSADRVLKIEVPCDLEPGRVEVVLAIPNDDPAEAARRRAYWEGMWGLGREVWEGVDPLEYLKELREDRDYGS